MSTHLSHIPYVTASHDVVVTQWASIAQKVSLEFRICYLRTVVAKLETDAILSLLCSLLLDCILLHDTLPRRFPWMYSGHP